MRRLVQIVTAGAAIAVLASAAALAQTSPNASASATGSVKVVQPISITKTADLRFGTITVPAANGSVTITSAGAFQQTGGVGQVSGPIGQASFTVQGQSSATFTISVDPTFTMTSGNNTLTVTTASSAASPATLSNTGNYTLGVGGTFPISNTTPTGAYSGSFNVSVAYN